jgi:basic membrane protein A
MPKAALVLNGPISDLEWGGLAFEGMMRIQDEFGAEVSYAENVSQSDLEDALRTYAEAGYDLVFGHGAQFVDPVNAVASEYPDTQFCVINGWVVEENITNVAVAQNEQGYLMGVAAALLSETGTVGIIGGMEIPPITAAVDAFSVGAKSINPDIIVLDSMVGDFVDAHKAKEFTFAMIDNGADVMATVAGPAGLGLIEACDERGAMVVGASLTHFDIAPETVVINALTEVPDLYTFVYDELVNGSLEQTIYTLGIKEDVVHFSDLNENFSEALKQEDLAAVIASVKSGDITF